MSVFVNLLSVLCRFRFLASQTTITMYNDIFYCLEIPSTLTHAVLDIIIFGCPFVRGNYNVHL